MLIALYSTFAERVIAAYFQDRLGPNRAGPGGLLQPLADGVKMFTKEDFIPNTPNKLLFIVGPGIAMSTALMTSAVIPWGKPINLFGLNIDLQVADVNIAILYVFGVISIGVYGIMIGGWASNNKFSLLGAVRASSQMISYEVAMGLSIIAVLMVVGSLSLRDIAEKQSNFIDWTGKFPYFSWIVFKQPLAFLVFLICSFAETNRTPFDLPECEAELIGGYHTRVFIYETGILPFFRVCKHVYFFCYYCHLVLRRLQLSIL